MGKVTFSFLIEEQLQELKDEEKELQNWLKSEARSYRDDATQVTEKRVAIDEKRAFIRRLEGVLAEAERLKISK